MARKTKQPQPVLPVPEQPRLYAHVRGNYVLATGVKEFILHRISPGDEIMPYVPQTEPGRTVNVVDREVGEVRTAFQSEDNTDAERAAWRTTERAMAYPLLSDQIGAIVKQIEMMTAKTDRHPEFQSILDRVAEVKKQLV